MSRSGHDDARTADRDDALRPRAESAGAAPSDRFGRDLTLPQGDVRERVAWREGTVALRGSETRVLATVGAFRVVPATDLEDLRGARDVWHGDVQHLAEERLLTRTRVAIDGQPTAVLVLTREGKALLDAHQPARDDGRTQQYHAGLVKPRELPHDAQLYRLYQAEAARLHAEGARVTRVVLDYELKREYQTFLHRRHQGDDADPESALQAFATAQQLPVVDGHLELPDVRLEVETPDGRLEVRDLELVTEHYSRGQLAGKARAGFTLYRAAGAGRLRGGPARTGGTPFDPRHLERLS